MNPRPPHPQCGALPGCATLRYGSSAGSLHRTKEARRRAPRQRGGPCIARHHGLCNASPVLPDPFHAPSPQPPSAGRDRHARRPCHDKVGTLRRKMERLAGVTGLEPAASGVTGQRSNQLSYTPEGRPGRPGLAEAVNNQGPGDCQSPFLPSSSGQRLSARSPCPARRGVEPAESIARLTSDRLQA